MAKIAEEHRPQGWECLRATGHVNEIGIGLANDTAARLALQYQCQPFSITFDRPLSEVPPAPSQTQVSAGALAGKTIRRNALLVVAANGPYYGGGFTVSAGARMRDGRLTLSIYRRFSQWEPLRHFHSISQGRYRYSPK